VITLRPEIHKLINFTWNKETLPSPLKESIIMRIYKMVIKLAVVITEGCHCYQIHTKFYAVHSYVNVNSLHRWNYWGVFIVDFDVTDQQLTRYYALIQILGKMGVQ